VNIGGTLKADAESTKVVEPCVSSPDHPAKFSQTTVAPSPAVCDPRLGAALAKFAAMWFGVVPAIGVNDFGLLERVATYTAIRHSGIDKRQQLGNVVVVRAGQDGTERDAIRIDEVWCLEPGRERSVGPSQFFARPNGSHRR